MFSACWMSANWLLLQNAESAMCYLLTRESVKWLVSSWPRRDRRMCLYCATDVLIAFVSTHQVNRCWHKQTTTLFLLFQLQLLTSASLQWGYKYKCFPFENSFSFTPFHNEWVFFPFQIRDVSYVNQWAVQQCFDLESEMTEKPDSI